ncbi:MAG TPA: CDP-diacylglycerol--serine O-phosphatidyltransferase [Gemmatimonadales bacterium]|nr:CDP-diacylglycerol--serine O-phosphatidyltransferase [Gemmatimonadales bacterium]
MNEHRDRRGVQRAVVVLPNGFTMANLFFGIYAIVAASRGDFTEAGWYVVLGGVCDAFDGRIARVTRSGSKFGEELDSLVDAITFGLAPGLIMYFAVLNRSGWDWIWIFLFCGAAVIRLARFNVEQAGSSKTHFRGLPSPAAGMTLATYYWFSQTELYQQTAIADLPWHVMLRFVMAFLAFLMISDVPYPAVPKINFRTLRGILGAVTVAAIILALIFLPKQFFFPVLLGYVAYGAGRHFLMSMLDRDARNALAVATGEPEAARARQSGSHRRVERADDERQPRRRRRRRKPSGGQDTVDQPLEDSGS